ncbi:MAG: substrate-binding domain-containing protein [Anaerolineae bacterium]|nr:substrate-binding domain-containing protein [Anaerolineae bacterium]
MRNGHQHPTVGVLAGWQVYETVIPVSFLDPVLCGIRTAAREQHCNLLLACGMGPAAGPAESRPAWPVLAPENDFVPVGPWNTDGLIVVNPLLAESRSRYIRELLASGFPLAFVGGAEGAPAVVFDNADGIRQALAHLVEHGHRRIAFIAGQPRDLAGDSGERLRAYRSFVQEHGLADDPRLVAYGFHVVEGGYCAMQEILRSGVSFTAVLASNDESALGAMRALQEAGLQIPHDVAIVGFDDRPEAVVQSPPLTSIHCSAFEAGYQALGLLLERLAGRGRDTEIVKVTTRLVVRQSCGCPPGYILPTVSSGGWLFPSHSDQTAARQRFAQTLAEMVMAETHNLSYQETCTLCERLLEAFTTSLRCGDAAVFHLALEDLLWRVAALGDNAHAWQKVLSALRSEALALLDVEASTASDRQIEDMLHRACVAVSASVQRQYMQYLVHQSQQADRAGPLTIRLLTALDEPQIFGALEEHLLRLGIRHIGIAFFEAEGDDPVAWSNLRPVPGSSDETIRFLSRTFPPHGLYREPFNLALMPLVIQGTQAGFVVFDADELGLCGSIVRQLAGALRSAQLYREATEGRRLAEEADRLKSRFLSVVSHELRTPLSLIIGLSEVLLHEETAMQSSETRRRDIERIHAAAQHLDGLIRDVLDLARSEIGQLRLVCEPLDLAEVLQPVLLVGEQMARDKGLTWRAELPQGLPVVWGDRTRLRQTVLNLVSNAVKFTARGEVTLRVEVGEGVVTVSVSDTGLGIPPEEQDLIFDEFRQSERTTARGYGGLGLGLAICKRLVEMHGGSIGVRSSGEEGAGSTFYFTLPAAEEGTLRPVVREFPETQRVLLLAGRRDWGERLRDHLVRQGFAVELEWADEQTTWLPRLLHAPPGAVVLDTSTATTQGWETLKVLKGNLATRDIPVLFYAPAEEEQGGGAVLELDYLMKPVGTVELARALEQRGLLKGEGKTILIVDDEPGILEMHARVVQAQSAGYRVLKARNGREALEVLRQERVDLVLLDLMMPELDGFGVLEEMRRRETTREIPVVVLTGQVLTEEDMERLNRGVAAVLSKGVFSVEETLVHIERALARSKRLGSEAQRLVRKAMAYIHEHYAEPLSRRDIAYHVGVSQDYLTRCFRQELGITPVAYLNRYRVHQAKALLAAGEQSITEVAMAVGFTDSNYFSRVFRQEVGISPTAYRHT